MSASVKRIAFVMTRLLTTAYGGDASRVRGICEVLGEDFEVHIIALCLPGQEQDASIRAPGVSSVTAIPVSMPRRLAGLARAASGDIAFQRALYEDPAAQRRVQRTLEELEPDLILCHLIRAWPYCEPWVGRTPVVVDLTDAISMNYAIRMEVGADRFPISTLVAEECRRVHLLEREVLERADAFCVVSPRDRAWLAERHPAAADRIMVARMGNKLADPTDPPMRTGVAFVGQLRTRPNRDAVRWYVDEIGPRLRERRELRQLRVVGPVPRRFRLRFSRRDDVQFTGPVPEIAPTIQACAAGVCPMRFGAGTQTKVLEYWAAGVPAVISHVAAQGLAGEADVHYLAAESPAEFAAALTRVVEEPATAARLAEAARELIALEYSWTKALAPLTHRVRQLMGVPEPVAAPELTFQPAAAPSVLAGRAGDRK